MAGVIEMPEKLQVRLLGGFEAKLGDGGEIALKGRKTQALLALLAMSAGRPVARGRLTGLLWSDRGEEQARGSLRQALAELRRALGPAGETIIAAERDSVTLADGSVESDLGRLELLANGGAEGSLADAAGLCRGEFLDGMDIADAAFEEWLAAERARVTEMARTVLGRLLEGRAQAGEIAAAIDTARALLALDPLQEAVHRRLMRLYLQQGDRAMALKQYEACREVLKAELGIEPDAETDALQAEIRRIAESRPADSRIEIAGDIPAPEPALPEKPSIAVLPFVNLSGDAEQDYFADGITEDVITELSRFHSLFVIGRNSSFHYKGQSPPTREVGRALGVRYVVEGSVRKAGERVRVAAQLVEAASGSHLWGERYDRELVDIFAVQDEVVRAIARAVGARGFDAGQRRALRMRPENLAAYDLWLRAYALVDKFTKDSNATALTHLDRSLELDPDSALAHATLAQAHIGNWMMFWNPDHEGSLRRAFEHARKAVALDDTDSYTRWTLGEVLTYRREYDEGRHQLETAVALNPNDVGALSVLGFHMAMAGQPDEALKRFEDAARMDPFDIDWRHWVHGMAAYAARRHDEAIASLTRVRQPNLITRMYLTASYAQAGQMDKARRQLQDFLRAAENEMEPFPGHRLADWEPLFQTSSYAREEDHQHLVEGMRKAGLGSG